MENVYPIKTGKMMFSVYSYLYKAESGYILFDAGMNTKAAQSVITELGIEPSDVAAVFLTHTDLDHVGALPLFPAAEIFMAGSNKAFLEEKAGRERSKNFVNMGLAYKTMNDGETVMAAGAEVQCIFAPGHTPGSANYIVDKRYLFTGDNLGMKGGKATLFREIYNMDSELQAKSIRKLASFPWIKDIEAVFTAHHGYSKDPANVFEEWR